MRPDSPTHFPLRPLLPLQFQLFKVITEISAVFWAFDRLVRFVNRMWLSFSSPRLSATAEKPQAALIKCASAQIRSCGQKYSRLRISVPSSKIRLPEQHGIMGGIAGGDDIRITVPRLQWVGEHPFTVFAAGRLPDDPSQGYIDLLIKTESGLTRKLAHHANKFTDLEAVDGPGEKSKVALMIEGPFGTRPDMQEATKLVLVAGGIAITFCWPLFVAAVKSGLSSKLRSCKLIWIVREESEFRLHSFMTVCEKCTQLTSSYFPMFSPFPQCRHSDTPSRSL